MADRNTDQNRSRLPETKDRTYEELDVLFEKRVSARKFQSTVVDAAAIEEVEKLNY
jgi:SP family general alpha glucoside:H+ symporter-like MFS transporter